MKYHLNISVFLKIQITAEISHMTTGVENSLVHPQGNYFLEKTQQG